jgi:hypothetical protein
MRVGKVDRMSNFLYSWQRNTSKCNLEESVDIDVTS